MFTARELDFLLGLNLSFKFEVFFWGGPWKFLKVQKFSLFPSSVREVIVFSQDFWIMTKTCWIFKKNSNNFPGYFAPQFFPLLEVSFLKGCSSEINSWNQYFFQKISPGCLICAWVFPGEKNQPVPWIMRIGMYQGVEIYQDGKKYSTLMLNGVKKASQWFLGEEINL